MKGFKKYVTENEDVADTIAKLPKHHQALVKGYKFLFEPGNTLHGDDGHVGEISNHPKKIIRISGPYRFSREHVVLHEIAHLVYEFYVKGTPLEKEWEGIVKNTKHKKEDEPPEENFCHAYASRYTKFKLTVFDHKDWYDFIDRLPKKFPVSNG